jgi:hypothetical protein
MDQETIRQIKETAYSAKNLDYCIELFEEGLKTLQCELQPIMNKIKIHNKEYAIDILEEQLLFQTDVLGFATKYLTEHSRMPISAETAMVIARLNGIINEIPKENDIEKSTVTVQSIKEII